jgi:hypothetical protein
MMAFRKYALLDIAHFVYHNNLKYFEKLWFFLSYLLFFFNKRFFESEKLDNKNKM